MSSMMAARSCALTAGGAGGGGGGARAGVARAAARAKTKRRSGFLIGQVSCEIEFGNSEARRAKRPSYPQSSRRERVYGRREPEFLDSSSPGHYYAGRLRAKAHQYQ